MLYILREMLKLFDSRREKMLLAALVVMSFICALLDLVGIGALVPLVMVLINPESFANDGILKDFFAWLPECSKSDLLFYAAIAVPVVFVIKNGVILFNVAIQQKFAFTKFWHLQKQLFNLYLLAPYSFHLRRNSSHLMRNLQMIDTIILGVVIPAVVMFSELLVVFLLSLFMLWLNPQFFIFIAFAMGAVMLIFYLLIKRRMHILGTRKMNSKEQSILNINQALGSIKEAIISGKEDYFLQEFSKHQKSIADVSYEEHIYIRGSSIFIETVTVITVSVLIMLALLLGQSPEVIIASLSVFTLVAVRIMPSINRISTQLSMLRNSAPCLHEILADLKAGKQICRRHETPDTNMITFQSQICLDNISFRYEGADKNVLEGISLAIPRNSMTGFAGTSGAGKTTIIDLILGLLEPSTGSVTVDGVDIRTGIRSWQRKLGYIPQNIYICDDTVRKNIAFGLQDEEIDEKRVAEAVRTAQLGKFIEQLPDGLNTVVGERGARISGGERQRIGIARALYHNPEILIMDEATASLDNLTEKAFMEAVNAISGKITIIIIAHRLTTLKNCNLIYFINNGTLDSGGFDDLYEKNPDFRLMAGNDLNTEEKY